MVSISGMRERHLAMELSATVYGFRSNSLPSCCLLYTSDAADERSSVDLGGRRIIKKKTMTQTIGEHRAQNAQQKKRE